jgi:hypothetical protein
MTKIKLWATNLTLAMVLLGTSLLVMARVTTEYLPMECTSFDDAIALIRDAEEQALFIARTTSVEGDALQTFIAVNPHTGTWSLIILLDNKTACLAGFGTNYDTFVVKPKAQL